MLTFLPKEHRLKSCKIFKNQELIRVSRRGRIPQKTCEMMTPDTTLWAIGCQRKSVKISHFERGLPFWIRDKKDASGRTLFLSGLACQRELYSVR